MDEPRPIVELLCIMREWCVWHFESRKCKGLCSATFLAERAGLISRTEQNIFVDYVAKTMPKYSFGIYGWPPYELQPRLNWLQEQIDLLTNQNQD